MRFRQSRVVLLSVCVALAGAVSACNQSTPAEPAAAPAPAAPAPQATAQSQVERGKMLIIGGGCHDCHTPKKLGPNGPEADMDRMLSGHPETEKITMPFKGGGKQWAIHVNGNLTAWSGDWGVSFAANLTPDENTGLGIWTEDMFVNALRQGKHMGKSRPILPPMPWNWYGQLPEEDLKAMFAYLRTIKPISNHVPVPLDPQGKPIEAP